MRVVVLVRAWSRPENRREAACEGLKPLRDPLLVACGGAEDVVLREAVIVAALAVRIVALAGGGAARVEHAPYGV
jgi:hypothetical protein